MLTRGNTQKNPKSFLKCTMKQNKEQKSASCLD